MAALVAVTAACVSVTSLPTEGPRSTLPQATTVPASAATSAVPQPGGGTGLCAFFTTDEIAAVVGQPVDNGLANEQVHTCVWSAREGDGYVLIQRIPASFYEEHTLDPGYHKVDGIGEEASITAALFGEGLALTVRAGESAYFVDLVPTTDDQAVIDLARQFIARSEAQ